MKWTELWDAVVRMLWHCRHERFEQGCIPMSNPVQCLQVCTDCGSVRWLPDPRGKGWQRPSSLQTLARTMPISHDLMTPELVHPTPGIEVADEPFAEIEAANACGRECFLAPDVVAATYAPNDPPRTLTCDRGRTHTGTPHHAEGWYWQDGRIWREDHA